MGAGRFEHRQADEVVGDQVHRQFLVDHRGGLAAQEVHAHRGLDVAEKQLGLPAAAVEVGEGFGGERDRIEKSRDDGDRLDAEAFDADAEGDFAQPDRFGQGIPDGLVRPARAGLGLEPEDEQVSRAEGFEGDSSDGAVRLSAHDAVHAALLEKEELGIAAEPAVGQNDIAGLEQVPERTEKLAFADVQGALGHFDQHAGAQAEQGHDAHDRKRAARLAPFGCG